VRLLTKFGGKAIFFFAVCRALHLALVYVYSKVTPSKACLREGVAKIEDGAV
jgi:hypothetical protein